jgi:phospholipid transport system transporter-binding protein
MKKKSGKSAAKPPGASRLPYSVAIRNARELRDHWLAQVSGAAMRIDGGSVNEVDSAGLQLLLAWQRAVVAAGGTFEWSSVSVPLRDAAAAVGLSRELGMPGET